MRAYLENTDVAALYKLTTVESFDGDKKVQISFGLKPKAYFEDNEFTVAVDSIQEYLDLVRHVERNPGGLHQISTTTDYQYLYHLGRGGRNG